MTHPRPRTRNRPRTKHGPGTASTARKSKGAHARHRLSKLFFSSFSVRPSSERQLKKKLSGFVFAPAARRSVTIGDCEPHLRAARPPKTTRDGRAFRRQQRPEPASKTPRNMQNRLDLKQSRTIGVCSRADRVSGRKIFIDCTWLPRFMLWYGCVWSS